MAEKGKSNVKASAVIYYALLTAALIGLIIFVYLRIMGGSLFLFGYVFGPYALMFAIVTAVLVLRFGSLLKSSGGKITYHSSLAAAAAVLSLVCLVYTGAEDVRFSKTVDMLVLNDGRNVLLTEHSERSEHTGKDNTYIDVYLLYGRMAQKLGRIDETCFSNKCIESDLYAYSVGVDDVITIECEYGSFGDGIVALEPNYGSTTIKYDFKLR